LITVVANLKGGSGKSTVLFNLALWLKEQGQSVVTFDLDPQGTLSDVADVRKDEGLEELLVFSDINELDSHRDKNVLIDVGASNMHDMKLAISMADRVLIPVSPSQPDLWATQRFLKIVKESAVDNDSLELLAFVNRADTHAMVRESDETEEALVSIKSIKVLPHRLCQRTMFRRTLSEGMSINEISPNSKSAQEFNILASALYADNV
jgi:chromosome partitioning protein